MCDRAVTPWERERKYQAGRAEAYEKRRAIEPRFTLAQAERAVGYLDELYETQAQGTTLRAFRDELARAIEAATRGS